MNSATYHFSNTQLLVGIGQRHADGRPSTNELQQYHTETIDVALHCQLLRDVVPSGHQRTGFMRVLFFFWPHISHLRNEQRSNQDTFWTVLYSVQYRNRELNNLMTLILIQCWCRRGEGFTLGQDSLQFLWRELRCARRHQLAKQTLKGQNLKLLPPYALSAKYCYSSRLGEWYWGDRPCANTPSL